MFATLLSLALLSASAPAELDALRRRADAVRPGGDDLRWQQIPWLIDATEALETARAERRPLFVWLASGRDRDGSPLERC